MQQQVTPERLQALKVSRNAAVQALLSLQGPSRLRFVR